MERPRSNTPLQALVLLNDPIFVEAARALATRMIHARGDTAPRQIEFAFSAVLNRSPTPTERTVLLDHHARLLEQYRGDANAATALVSIGEHPIPADISAVDLAAMTGVARVILSLHESLTRY